MRTAGKKDELIALEARKAQLVSETRHAPAPVPRLRPKLAEIYRGKVANLTEALNAADERAEAAEALRDLSTRSAWCRRTAGSRSSSPAISPPSWR